MDKEILSKVVENLTEFTESRVTVLSKLAEDVGKARSVESVMSRKAVLLLEWLVLPLGQEFCYFCIEQDQINKGCGNCLYGKRNRNCKVGGSSYNNISIAINKARDSIVDRYPLKNANKAPSLNKEALQRVCGHLKETIEALFKRVRLDINHLSFSSTVKEVMSKKTNLMYNWIYLIPLSVPDCYFCEAFNQECEDCYYGKQRGVCTDHNSDFTALWLSVHSLKTTIDEEYPMKGDSNEGEGV